jgi:putative toxin-antitoxin system antitoxin component (TIGR02293 family)
MATQALGEDIFGATAAGDAALAQLSEQGLPLDSVAQLRTYGLTFAEVAELVIAPRTLKHRKARGERLSTEESERLLRVARILALAERIFGDREKSLGWLRDPDYNRLDGRNCLSVLRTEAGGRLVENMLGQIDHGYFS